jgi:hypothetical protein
MDEWQSGTCERCAAEGDVRQVSFVVHDEQHSQVLCRDCKELTLERARVKVIDPTVLARPSRVLSLAGWLVLGAAAVVFALTIYGALTR